MLRGVVCVCASTYLLVGPAAGRVVAQVVGRAVQRARRLGRATAYYLQIIYYFKLGLF